MLADTPRGVNQRDSRLDYVVPGLHAVSAFLEARPAQIARVLTARTPPPDLAQRLSSARIQPFREDSRTLDRLSGGVPHQGVIAVGRPPEPLALEDLCRRPVTERQITIVLDGITDPRNAGAILRTAEALGAAALILPKDRSVDLSPALVKAAAGAVEWLPLVRVTNVARCLAFLKEKNHWVVGLAAEGNRQLHDADAIPGFPVTLVLGAEGEGMRRLVRESCDGLVRIPMVGHTASLNVSVAAALAVYELRRTLSEGPRS
jgi:23S rRNA (guanosine2251-2'-O)-methyltransferase